MSTSRKNIHELFEKVVSNKCSEQELEVFFQLVKDLPDDDEFMVTLDNWWQSSAANEAIDPVKGRRIQQQIQEQIRAVRPTAVVRKIRSSHIWWSAASVILLLAGAYLWMQYQPFRNGRFSDKEHLAELNIEPGKEGAILTLDDGTQVVLDSMKNGIIATQSGTQVVLEDGQLAYDPGDKAAGAPTWNTITTPKGRQFNLVLPDGTHLWLNAASSVKYPTLFTGKERRIEVTGEVYMEVAKNAGMPFRVRVNKQAVIDVLGTHFNVKAYSDETEMATTLLEGSVKMYPTSDTACWTCTENAVTPVRSAVAGQVILKPGQQALLADAGIATGSQTKNGNKSPQIAVVNAVNTGKVMAWKNGFFNFEGTPFKEAMNQLMRWYNIEVVYEESLPDIEFYGEISRNFTLADLLKALQDVGLHYRIESGRKLVVLHK